MDVWVDLAFLLTIFHQSCDAPLQKYNGLHCSPRLTLFITVPQWLKITAKIIIIFKQNKLPMLTQRRNFNALILYRKQDKRLL